MVLPPQGSERGQASDLADVERALLQGGRRVISSGITGRVVRDNVGNRVETAAQLSDLERALVLARTSNAEALLQVAEFRWYEDETRAFVRGESGQLEEVARGTPVNPGDLVRVHEALLRFRAKVINVENGEIEMAVDIWQGTSHVISPPKSIPMEFGRTAAPQDIGTDTLERRRTVVAQVMAAFLSRLGNAAPTVSAGTGAK